MMRVRSVAASVAVALVALIAPVIATATPAGAGPPPVHVTVSLNCPTGVYSYLTHIFVFDKAGVAVVANQSLECGVSTHGTLFNYPQTVTVTGTKPATFCWYQWYWEAGSNIASGFNGACAQFPVSPGPKPDDSASTVGGPAGLTLTIH